MPLNEIRARLGKELSDDDLIQILFNQSAPPLMESIEQRRARAVALVQLIGETEEVRRHLSDVLELNCVLSSSEK
ncbi:hypothetical protein ABFT80_14615 [Mesorhizobium sp. SB112]|uniref:hypothetical protein n=1 Tax=Mesorhizobium sp. SB112 TaxID=3151853 RepID=UPI003266B799